MGWSSRCRWAALAVAAALPLFAGWAAPAGAVPKKGTTLPEASRLTQVGHAAFWHCPAKTTELQIGVNTLTLHAGASLDISFTVHNDGTSSCNYTAPYVGGAPGPTSTTLTAGPCGSVGYEIEDSHRHDVWPGTLVVNCPALAFASLAAGASVSGTASWGETRPDSTRRVPAGTYTLVVENAHFTFPLRVTGS